MATRPNRQVAYGLSSALPNMAPLPIIAQRAPTASDQGEIGQTWIDVSADSAYTLTSISAGASNWATSPASGVGNFTSLTVNPGNATITAGNLDVTAGNFNVGGNSTFTGTVITASSVVVGTTLGVTGDTTLTGLLTANGNVAINADLAVTGNVTVTGDFDITDTASISLTSTNNAAGAITLLANGGAAETVLIRSAQGTSASSLNLLSTVGGITLTAGLGTADAINLVTSNAAGGIDIDSGTAGFIVDTTGAVSLDSAAASNVTVTGAGLDLLLNSVGGSVLVESTEDAALAIRLHANGGVSETIQIHSDQGTGVASVGLLSDVGGLTLRSTGLASADAINLEAAAGGIDVDAALQINVASSQNAADAIVINASAGGIDVTAAGAAGEDIDIVNTAGSINLNSGEIIGNSMTLVSAGGLDMTVAGTGSLDIDIVNTSGSINITSGEAVADSIVVTSGGGIDVIATNAAIDVTSGTGAINVGADAAAKTITIGNVTGATSVVVNVGTGALNLGTSATAHATAVGSTTAGSTLALNTPTGVNTVAANGLSVTTAGRGLSLPGGVLVLAGAGSPDTVVTAPAGSLFLRTDPAGATSRAYINTDGAMAWTNITCAA